jgi:DNA-binding NtrC family response regulator
MPESASRLNVWLPNSNQMKETNYTMPDQGSRALVFVVDDEPTIAQTASMVLCGHGFDARAFTDPIVALKAARIEPPNLLLADVIMPGLNGFELCIGVVEDCPQCKVILFSGNPSARESHATTPTEKKFDLLIKPIQPVDLLRTIRTKLES